MHSARVAEWILRLVTTPERAAAITGDLIDDASGSGMPRFWWHLGQTVFSLIRRDLTDNPGRMAGLAFRAWLLEMALFAGASFVVFIVMTVGGIALKREQFFTDTIVGISGYYAIKVLFLVCEFQVGKWVARRAAGHEVSAVCAFGLAQLVAETLLAILAVRAFGADLTLGTAVGTLLQETSLALVSLPLVFAGALRYRHLASLRNSIN